MALTNFPNGVESAVGFVGPMSGGAVSATTLDVSGNATIGDAATDTLTINSITTIPLAALPEYADQAAAATALPPGRLFRFATTGAIGVALT